MHVKRFLTIILLFAMVSVFAACTNKNENPDGAYIYLPKTELHTVNEATGFYCEYKYKYEYDSYGNIVKREDYTKRIFYARDRCVDTTYTYDENGEVLKEHIRTEEFSTYITDRHFVREGGFDYFYNEYGKLVRKDYIYISYMDDGIRGYKYEYDEQGNCVKEISYYSDGSEETNIEYKYNSDNKLIKETHFTSFKTMFLRYILKEIDYTYDDDGRMIFSKITFNYESGEMSHYIENTYRYDEQSRLIKKEAILFEANGEKTREEFYEYKDFAKVAIESQ